MRSSDWGSDVCSSDLSLSAYNASKWGIRGLAKAAAMEYGHKGVRVNSVHPGGIDTAMGNPFSEARAEANKRYTMVPLQRIGEPSEVAYTSLFLASDEASYLSGAEIAEIGRASCRESGCQSGEISVVAVTVDKKNQINKQ